jgi:anti-sigma B factor antagonist
MDIVRETSEGSAVVRLAGELDLATATQAQTALEDAMRSSASVILDLSGLEFMDSSGLRVIIATDRSAKESGKRLRIVKGPETVQRVFELTGLEDHFEMIEG